MYRNSQQWAVVKSTVEAYNDLKATFESFTGLMQKALSKDTLYRVSFVPESPVAFLLTFFDRLTIDVDFEMVTDKLGKPRGRIMFRAPCQSVIKTLYFDTAGDATKEIHNTMAELSLLEVSGIDDIVYQLVQVIIADDLAFPVVE